MTGATLTASDFYVSFGSSTAQPSVTGTVSLTLMGVQLFPAGGWVTSQATSVTGSYSFGGFDGNDPSGQLSLTIAGFQMSIGQAFLLTANGNITISP